MFQHYWKAAWRHIIKDKAYSTLNILGLALGIGVALIIGLWVYHQYSYDRFLKYSCDIYQVRRNFYGNGDTVNYGGTSLKLAGILRSEVPEIEYVAETDGFGKHGLMVGNKKIFSTGGQVGKDFLHIFSYEQISGSAETALQEPYSIVLTERTAITLFGKVDVIGKSVRIDDKNNLTITAILKDPPGNSTFQFDYLVPFSYLESTDDFVRRARTAGFGWTNFAVYVKTRAGTNYNLLERKIRALQHRDSDNNMSMHTDIMLHPLLRWHLYSRFENGKAVGGFVDYVKIFALIGALVLLIACINFINLTTARSEKRGKEVGIRKVAGSSRLELVLRFLSESVLLTLLAFAVSVGLVQLALPAFNELTGSPVRIPYESIRFWGISLCGVLLTGLAAGYRPALYLSSFATVKALKSQLGTGKGSTLSRKTLVVLQFTCSIALIISTVIIYQQITHAKNRPTGYDIDRLLITDMNGNLGNGYSAIKKELLDQRIAASVTTASVGITTPGNHRDVDAWEGKRPGESVNMGAVTIGDDYFRTIGMTMKEGRGFEYPSDTTRVIFNEAAVKLLRLENPVNQNITWFDNRLTIIGVVKDALTASPFAPADPTIYFYDAKPQSTLMYRLSPQISTSDAISRLNGVFNRYNPSYPFTYTFADDSYVSKFRDEYLVGKLSGLFATLAVLISCLGLFGLAAYMAEQRRKEIGVRKVLGASVIQLWLMLSTDFVILTIIATLVASPLACYYMHQWLLQYDYRIQISPSVFFWVAAGAILITTATVSFKAVTVALMNPVKSLRSE